MSRGEPLTDAERMLWLVRVHRAAVEAAEGNEGGEMSGVLVACSALKASYRKVLRGEAATTNGEKGDSTMLRVEERREGDKVTPAWKTRPPPRAYFVHPFGPRSILLERMTNRKSHFMKANMLASQLDTLENPAGEEGAVEIRLDASREEQIRLAIEGLRVVGAIPACY